MTRAEMIAGVTAALRKSGLGITGDYIKDGEVLAAEAAVDALTRMGELTPHDS